jgi:hypothetical protein
MTRRVAGRALGRSPRRELAWRRGRWVLASGSRAARPSGRASLRRVLAVEQGSGAGNSPLGWHDDEGAERGRHSGVRRWLGRSGDPQRPWAVPKRVSAVAALRRPHLDKKQGGPVEGHALASARKCGRQAGKWSSGINRYVFGPHGCRNDRGDRRQCTMWRRERRGAATWTRGGGQGSTPDSGAAPANVVR